MRGPKLRLPRFLSLLRFFIGFKLTPVGRLAVGALFLSALGSVTVEIPIYQIFCGMIALFGISELTGLLFRPKLEVRGWLPERVTAGETAVGSVTVENRGWLPACDLMCALFGLPAGLRHIDGHLLIPSLKRGEQANLPVSIRTAGRGDYVLPEIRVHSTFPFNLMRFGSARLPARRLIVLPSFSRLDECELPLSQRYQPGGVLVAPRPGDSPEYVGNREYVCGEPARRLDFRAWARVGKPVVREYQDEFCSRVALVLDTCRPGRSAPPPAGFKELEAAISLTAAVADALNETEAKIDLLAAGPDLFLFQTAAGTPHFESILEILASVEHTRHNPFEEIAPVIVDSLESVSVVVCVLLDWDESRQELTRRIVESGCSLRVLLVRSHEPSLPFPEDDHFSWISPEEILAGGVDRL